MTNALTFGEEGDFSVEVASGFVDAAFSRVERSMHFSSGAESRRDSEEPNESMLSLCPGRLPWEAAGQFRQHAIYGVY